MASDIVTDEIEGQLRTIFRDNPEAREKWLDAEQELLGNRTPRQILATGKLEDRKAVRDLLGKVTGW